MNYSNQIAEKKILSRSRVISIFVKFLKNQKNRNISLNIEFYGLILSWSKENQKLHKKKSNNI
jgi:hypothetical protein